MARQGLPQEPPQVIDLGGAGKEKLLNSDALAEFHSEADWPQEVPVSAPRETPPREPLNRAAGVSFPAPTVTTHSSPFVWIAVLLAAVAIAEAPFVAMWVWERADNTAETTTPGAAVYGTVFVETEPAGMEVWINGDAAGRTPTQLSIPAGAAEIQLRHADRVRTVPLTIAPEEVLRLRVELPASLDESVWLSDSFSDLPTDMVVVVSAEAKDLALMGDAAEKAPPSSDQDPLALALAQPSPAQ